MEDITVVSFQDFSLQCIIASFPGSLLKSLGMRLYRLTSNSSNIRVSLPTHWTILLVQLLIKLLNALFRDERSGEEVNSSP